MRGSHDRKGLLDVRKLPDKEFNQYWDSIKPPEDMKEQMVRQIVLSFKISGIISFAELPNYFSKTFSNLLNTPTNPIMKSLALIFKLATSTPLYLPVDHLALTDRYGSLHKNFKTPQVVQLIPRHPEWISKNAKADLRDTLAQIRVGSVLYDMFGVADGERHFIGSLQLKSKFINSQYCDQKLFFQHHSVEAAQAQY